MSEPLLTCRTPVQPLSCGPALHAWPSQMASAAAALLRVTFNMGQMKLNTNISRHLRNKKREGESKTRAFTF